MIHSDSARLQGVLQELTRREEPRLDRLLRQLEDLADVLVAHVQEVLEHDNRRYSGLMVIRAPCTRWLTCSLSTSSSAPRRSSTSSPAIGSCRCRPVEGVDRFIERYPVDPAVEPVFRVVVREVLECLQEHRLGDVPRVLGIPEHPQGRVEDRLLVSVRPGLRRLACRLRGTAGPVTRRCPRS